MKKKYLILTISIAFAALTVNAQTRYIDAIYSDADIEVTSDIEYGTNIDFLTSTLDNPANILQDITAIKTAIATSQPIPASHYNPADASTDVKVTVVKMDVYKAKTSVDASTNRPVIIFIHTGNFLPPPINGSPVGIKTDSSAIVLCTEWAKRGYVAVSVDYRLGWNPLATSVEVRRGQLLNAVFRAIHDVKKAVRFIRDDAAGTNSYGVNADNITLYGEGTGAYVALAYETLDKPEEMELTKFRAGGVGPSYIDTMNVGNIEGFGGTLNLYPTSATSSDITSVVTAGGALADTSWLEAGDAPMIAFHCIRDPFAPFSEGTVIVPTTNEDVVDVQGANVYIQKAVVLGNNDVIKGIKANDVYTQAARASYGQEFDYIYAAPFDKITVNTEVEGLFPIIRPLNETVLNNEAGPWQFWDPTSPLATAKVGEVGGMDISAHMNSVVSNPGMGPDKARGYIDTICGYMCPRIALINGDITLSQLSIKNVLPKNAATMYPNPAANEVTVSVDSKYQVTGVSIFDIAGREVISKEATNLTTISLEGLESGYYFVNVNTKEGTVTNKLIKE
ncbi:MAG: hypothetical protein COA58_10890 [Bacteroidetes bacterium]|nr:MAG: hypothetical protein COA58_10890 [Bacteroidota bacterium]